MNSVSFCVILLVVAVSAGPVHKSNRPMRREMPDSESSRPKLELPSNATSIRADITDNFSCENRQYGYYADVENECQIFHVCLPVMYEQERKERTFRWSFICPEETYFSQKAFTCVRMEDMVNECKDSEQYYELNGNFGAPSEKESAPEMTESEMTSEVEVNKEMQEDQKPAASERIQMIEKIEASTDGKLFLLSENQENYENQKKTPFLDPSMGYKEDKVVEVDNEIVEAEHSSSPIKVIINQMEMGESLLPPLKPEEYRVGIEPEEVIAPEVKVDVIETALPMEKLQEIEELHVEEMEKEPLTIQNTKDEVIKTVENLIKEAETSENEEIQQVMGLAEPRRYDPRRRRFVFKADAKKY